MYTRKITSKFYFIKSFEDNSVKKNSIPAETYFIFSKRDNFLKAYSTLRAFDLLPILQDVKSIQGVLPRVYLAPRFEL